MYNNIPFIFALTRWQNIGSWSWSCIPRSNTILLRKYWCIRPQQTNHIPRATFNCRWNRLHHANIHVLVVIGCILIHDCSEHFPAIQVCNSFMQTVLYKRIWLVFQKKNFLPDSFAEIDIHIIIILIILFTDVRNRHYATTVFCQWEIMYYKIPRDTSLATLICAVPGPLQQ